MANLFGKEIQKVTIPGRDPLSVDVQPSSYGEQSAIGQNSTTTELNNGQTFTGQWEQ